MSADSLTLTVPVAGVRLAPTDGPTVYGRPALPVAGSDGGAVLYLFAAVGAGGGEIRAWELTSPAGAVRRVCERWPGHFGCSCPDYWFRRRYDLDPECKHVRAVKTWVCGPSPSGGAAPAGA